MYKSKPCFTDGKLGKRLDLRALTSHAPICTFGMGIYIIPFSGVILRDSHGVAQVRFVTGNKILRILKSKGLAPDLPEDLYHLIKKAVAVRKHLERNRKVREEDYLY